MDLHLCILTYAYAYVEQQSSCDSRSLKTKFANNRLIVSWDKTRCAEKYIFNFTGSSDLVNVTSNFNNVSVSDSGNYILTVIPVNVQYQTGNPCLGFIHSM